MSTCNLKRNDYCLMRCCNNISGLDYPWFSEELITEFHNQRYIHVTNEVLVFLQGYSWYAVDTLY